MLAWVVLCFVYGPFLSTYLFSTLFSQLWYLEHFRLATRTRIWDNNSALLFVANICATYIFISVPFQATHIFFSDRYSKRILAILVSPPHRYHELAAGCTNSCFVLGKEHLQGFVDELPICMIERHHHSCAEIF